MNNEIHKSRRPSGQDLGINDDDKKQAQLIIEKDLTDQPTSDSPDYKKIKTDYEELAQSA